MPNIEEQRIESYLRVQNWWKQGPRFMPNADAAGETVTAVFKTEEERSKVLEDLTFLGITGFATRDDEKFGDFWINFDRNDKSVQALFESLVLNTAQEITVAGEKKILIDTFIQEGMPQGSFVAQVLAREGVDINYVVQDPTSAGDIVPGEFLVSTKEFVQNTVGQRVEIPVFSAQVNNQSGGIKLIDDVLTPNNATLKGGVLMLVDAKQIESARRRLSVDNLSAGFGDARLYENAPDALEQYAKTNSVDAQLAEPMSKATGLLNNLRSLEKLKAFTKIDFGDHDESAKVIDQEAETVNGVRFKSGELAFLSVTLMENPQTNKFPSGDKYALGNLDIAAVRERYHQGVMPGPLTDILYLFNHSGALSEGVINQVIERKAKEIFDELKKTNYAYGHEVEGIDFEGLPGYLRVRAGNYNTKLQAMQKEGSEIVSAYANNTKDAFNTQKVELREAFTMQKENAEHLMRDFSSVIDADVRKGMEKNLEHLETQISKVSLENVNALEARVRDNHRAIEGMKRLIVKEKGISLEKLNESPEYNSRLEELKHLESRKFSEQEEKDLTVKKVMTLVSPVSLPDRERKIFLDRQQDIARNIAEGEKSIRTANIHWKFAKESPAPEQQHKKPGLFERIKEMFFPKKPAEPSISAPYNIMKNQEEFEPLKGQDKAKWPYVDLRKDCNVEMRKAVDKKELDPEMLRGKPEGMLHKFFDMFVALRNQVTKFFGKQPQGDTKWQDRVVSEKKDTNRTIGH